MRSKKMKSLLNLGKRFAADEKGAEVTELGIVLALIVALSITLIATLGTDVQTAYQSVVTALNGL